MNIAQTLLLHDDEIAGFDQSPLEISIHVRLDWPGFVHNNTQRYCAKRIGRCQIPALFDSHAEPQRATDRILSDCVATCK